MRNLRRFFHHAGMARRRILALALLAALAAMGLLAGVALAQSGGGLDLSWWTLDGGGGMLQGGSYALSGSVGQPDGAGPLTGGGYALYGGFWSPQAATGVTPTPTPGSGCPDPYEPNDDYAQAQSISPGSPIQAYICTDQDADFFKFQVTAGQRITIDLTDIPAGTDYDLWLSDPGQNQVASSTNSGQADERIEHTAASSGVYYVSISPYAGSSATQPYRLRVALSGGGSTPAPQRLYLPIISRRR